MGKSKKKKKKNKYLVGIDLGGTKVLAAIMTKKGKILTKVKRVTPVEEGPDAVITQMADAVERAMDKAGLKRKHIRVVGVGAPGPLDPKTGMVHFAPNLKWENVPLAEKLGEALKLPVFVYNDVDAGTYGEFRLGAGRGKANVIGIFPGTGIGGGIILEKQLQTGARGSAGELGHTVILADGPVCGCGNKGCAEAVASRTAIGRDIRLAIDNGRESIITKLVDDLDEERITSGVLKKAAKKNDPLILEILGRTAYYLGLLTANTVNALDPEAIVFGGGLIEACERWLMPTIRSVAQQYYVNKRGAEAIDVVEAELGDYATVLGAAMLARNRWKRLKKQKKKAKKKRKKNKVSTPVPTH